MNKVITLLVVVIFILLIFLSYGIAKLSTNIQPGEVAMDPDAYAKTLGSYTDKGLLNPWPHSEPDPGSVALPSTDQLMNIYKEIRKAYANRDYELYKKYASTERIWHMEHNKIQEAGMVDSLFVFSVMETDGEINFTNNGLLLSAIDAPEIQNIQVLNAAWETKELSPGAFLMIDKENKEKYKVEGQNWTIRVNLNVTIVDNGYQKGNGIIYFVYDDGVYKYHFEEWENEFTSGKDLGDIPSEGEIVFTVDKNEGEELPPDLYLQKGQYVKWPAMNGFVMSQNDSPSHFSSPFLVDSSYTKKFDVQGDYEYVIFDNLYNELFRGKVHVE